MSTAVKEAAGVVAERAKHRVPVGAPDVHLRDAIHVEREGPAGYYVVAGDNDAWYGHLVEHGTSHSAPRPFLVPSLEESRDDAVEFVRTALVRL